MLKRLLNRIKLFFRKPIEHGHVIKHHSHKKSENKWLPHKVHSIIDFCIKNKKLLIIKHNGKNYSSIDLKSIGSLDIQLKHIDTVIDAIILKREIHDRPKVFNIYVNVKEVVVDILG